MGLVTDTTDGTLFPLASPGMGLGKGGGRCQGWCWDMEGPPDGTWVYCSHCTCQWFIEFSLHPAPLPTDVVAYLVEMSFVPHNGVAAQPQEKHWRSSSRWISCREDEGQPIASRHPLPHAKVSSQQSPMAFPHAPHTATGDHGLFPWRLPLLRLCVGKLRSGDHRISH